MLALLFGAESVSAMTMVWPPALIEQGIHPHPRPCNKHVHVSYNVRSLHAHWERIVEWDNVHSYAFQETWMNDVKYLVLYTT